MFIRTPGYVLKSTTPAEHKATFEANETNRAAAVAKMEAYAELLLPGSEPWAYQNDTGAVCMTGILVPHGVDVDDVPAGLRWDTKAKRGTRILVPAKKTEDGKDVVMFMDALDFSPQPLGEVSRIVTMGAGEKRYFTSAIVEVLGDDVYATYHLPVCDESHGSRPSDRAKVEADPGWEPCKLSEFFAAREVHAPEKASV